MEKLTNVKALEYVLANYDLPADVAEKVANMKASFEKKAVNKKATANQEANDGLRTVILEVLGNAKAPMSIADITKARAEFADFTPQKMSALLKPLTDNEFVVKTMDKKKAYFSIKAVDTAEVDE